jgi:HEAT repeat protein
MNQTRALSAIVVLLLPVCAGAQTSPPRQAPNRETSRALIAAALQHGEKERALAVYDSYVVASGKPDAALLGQIAKADLNRIVRLNKSQGPVALSALERLARAGDSSALQALKRQAAEAPSMSSEDVTLTSTLVRLSDPGAMEKLGKLLAGASSDRKSEAIRVVQDAGARSLAPQVAQYLEDPLPQVRCAAALATGVLQYADAIPRLQEIFTTDEPIVRLFAATALKRLGQTSANAYLMNILHTGAPEVRLIAAEAYQSSVSTQWIQYVTDLLNDPNETHRLRAAEVIACCNQGLARGPLMSAVGSDNPSLRAEAARILEAKNLADVRIARRLLGDPVDAVSVYGAGAALRAAARSPAG